MQEAAWSVIKELGGSNYRCNMILGKSKHYEINTTCNGHVVWIWSDRDRYTIYIYTYYIGYIGIWSFTHTHINMDTEHMHTEMNAYLPMPSEWSAGHRFPWRTSGSRHGDEGVRKWGEYGINGDIAKDITGIYIIIIMYIYIYYLYIIM